MVPFITPVGYQRDSEIVSHRIISGMMHHFKSWRMNSFMSMHPYKIWGTISVKQGQSILFRNDPLPQDVPLYVSLYPPQDVPLYRYKDDIILRYNNRRYLLISNVPSMIICDTNKN